jgi:hypothetical protein
MRVNFQDRPRELTMSVAKTSETSTAPSLGDESFMTADELRSYMDEMAMAQASSEVNAMAQAEKAQAELVKTMSKTIEVTPDVVASLTKRLLSSMREAAKRGATEMMVMRFPNSLCVDGGRAINNSEEGWPETLIGRPRQAYEFWRDHLRPANYKLKAMIIDWPRGMPGDVGFFLSWSGQKAER